MAFEIEGKKNSTKGITLHNSFYVVVLIVRYWHQTQ
jgi:hypothetical protein